MSENARRAREGFANLARRPDADLDLEQGAILIAAEEYPDLEPSEITSRLDQLGEIARDALEGVASGPERSSDSTGSCLASSASPVRASSTTRATAT